MAHIVTYNTATREGWLQQLSDVITDPEELLRYLSLENHPELRAGIDARRLFALRVPRSFAARMKKGDATDPLLRQVITLQDEFYETPGYSVDPLEEQSAAVPGLLHKYHNRALLLVKGGCAVNCRYCFRRHFPYHDNPGNKESWKNALNYLSQHTELDELIFSGGDPLMAKDHELDWLITEVEKIPHLQRLRIHSRLPVVIPDRITDELCQRFARSRLQIVLVTHINHENEIDSDVKNSMQKLKNVGVTLLNQSVLLKGINDNCNALVNLSNALFSSGILPYYLHVLDKVQGAAHFMVDDNQARHIIRKMLETTSGYLVPKLTREIGGQPSKTPLDLNIIPL
ncbi:EF-P beta-lysylation protein EpmB [Limnobaculum zhutongyuii]|uniref:L-lysine 2,3-aminomutase n=1 Tax=Limnobaculum zhutongyuii TaxID=2498113 RepID=A0A411WG39_9GAMM|nr:EF-P beta-lysylation protein EpmB [Limnobaculum zhutongyuii]QBH95182.1 EF-P beta-lysylation protein EpmB [Limnobaculum zhutongyuii]TQS86411.1 EF-P beta-lysylation protein EpmB [Limnobaculum zhutongyuii]